MVLFHKEGKGKGLPITCHEDIEGEKMNSSTFPLTSALDGGGWSNVTPRPLYPREWRGTYCIEGWVGPTAGLDGCGKSLPHRDSIPVSSSP
jgi:hypothetical protein